MTAHNDDDDVLPVPCEWSDGAVEQRPVRKSELTFVIVPRLSAQPQLTRIGAEIGRATWLTVLCLNCHQLDSLPDELDALTGLRRLVLNDNAFKRVPACVLRLTALQTLWLNENPLEELPDELGNLQALTHVGFARCPLLPWLPSSVARLTHLKWLAFDARTISWLPSTMRSMTGMGMLSGSGLVVEGERAVSAKLNQLLDDCHERERALLTELAIGLAPLSLPVLLMTLIWERVHGARMPDAAGWFVSEQRRWRVFEAVHKSATKEQ